MKYSLRPSAVKKSAKSIVSFGLATLLLISGLFGALPYFLGSASATTLRETCATSCPYTSLQDAINAAAPHDTINITSDLTTSAQVNITKPLTIEGNGHAVIANFSKTSNSNNSVITVLSTSDVTISNLIADANRPAYDELHAFNAYQSTNILIKDSTAKNALTGVVVNASEVTLNNHTSINNLWHGINVDKGTASMPAVLTVTGTSTHTGDTIALYLESPGSNNAVEDNTTTNQYSEVMTGVYVAAAPDSTKPAISITAPTAGYATKSNFTVSVEAGDDSGLAQIGLNVYNESNSTFVNSCGSKTFASPPNTTSATYDCTINVSSYVDGTYTIRAAAKDLAGKVTVTTQKFVLDRVKPMIDVANPADFSYPFSVGPTVTVEATDALSGVATTVIHAYNANDDSYALFCPVSNSDTATCDLSSLPNGDYYFKAAASDNAGNIGAVVQTFQIDTVKPKLTVTAPVVGDEFRDTITVSGTAQDVDSGIAGDAVTLQLRKQKVSDPSKCGAYVGAPFTATVDGSNNWSTTFDSNNYADGNYCLEATVYDNASNQRTKRVKFFTIDNTEANLTVTTPSDSETIDLSVVGYSVTGTVSDDLTGVDRVVLLVNDSLGNRAYREVTRDFTAGSWSIDVPARSLADGTYRFNVTAYDNVGNPVVIRKTVIVKTAVTPPVVTPTPTSDPSTSMGDDTNNSNGQTAVLQTLTSGGTINNLTPTNAGQTSENGEVLGSTTDNEAMQSGETKSATTTLGNNDQEREDSSRFLGLGWWWILVLSGVGLLAYYWFVVRKADQA